MKNAERQETIEFILEVIDSRIGIVKTHIVRVVQDRVISSGYNGQDYTRNGGVQKGYREVLGTVDGYINYQEQDEWIALLS